MDLEAMMKRLMETAARLGLPFGERKKTYNSRLAQELGLWAESQNRGDPFHLAAFQAYFVHGKNLAKKDVLLDLAESVGLSRTEAESVLENRTFRDAVDRDWDEARRLGITAVPTMIFNENRLVGAQPYEKMAELVRGEYVGINGIK